MAERAELEFTYSLIDRVFRISLGELADFSGAKYDGDFSLTLEEAQLRKHDYVAEQIGLAAECRVLDLGCGWSPLLDYSRSLGATGLGVTLSSAQVAACRAHDPARTPAAGLPVFSAEQFPEMLRECVQHAVALAG